MPSIATIPVEVLPDRKKPRTSHWQRVGLQGSAQLGIKFAEADAFGMNCGKRNGITLVDIDSNDERMLDEAQRIFGAGRLIWRTGNGNYAIPYRYNGEGRRIRPMPGLPIDVLGAGLAVLPPSLGARGRRYEIVQGKLADLDRLPTVRPWKADTAAPFGGAVPEGKRDDYLFRRLLREARYCDDFDAVLDVARSLNMNCEPPLADTQVIKVTKSAWGIEISGKNWAGRKARASTDREEILELSHDPHAALLLNLLRVSHPTLGTPFAIDQVKTAELLGWSRPTIKARISTLMRAGRLERIHKGTGMGNPHLYLLLSRPCKPNDHNITKHPSPLR
jgi:Primase C terminal 1 (PriCT-1)